MGELVFVKENQLGRWIEFATIAAGKDVSLESLYAEMTEWLTDNARWRWKIISCSLVETSRRAPRNLVDAMICVRIKMPRDAVLFKVRFADYLETNLLWKKFLNYNFGSLAGGAGIKYTSTQTFRMTGQPISNAQIISGVSTGVMPFMNNNFVRHTIRMKKATP